MIKVRFKSNLDNVMRREIWPDQLPAVPRVGDLVQSARLCYVRDGVKQMLPFQLELEVCRVTWESEVDSWRNASWTPVIELNIIHSRFASMTDFERFYNSFS